MYNQEIFNKLVEKYGPHKAIEVCDVVSELYNIKYENCKTQECLEEYAYEREWWAETAISLKQQQLT